MISANCFGSQDRYQIYWLREAQGGLLPLDHYGMDAPLDALPVNETLAARIRAAAMPRSTQPTPLYMPYLTLRERTQWPARQMELPVASAPDGRVVVGDDAGHQFAALLAGRSPVVFTDRRTWNGATDWEHAVLPMIEAHHLSPPPGWRPKGPFEATWTIELPASRKMLWPNVPHRSEAAFLEEFRGLSSSVQRALRQWIPYQYFHAAERYEDPLRCKQYLAYSVLPTHPSRRKTQLTFHVLEPQRIISSMTRLPKPLGEWLRRSAVRAHAHSIDPTPYVAESPEKILAAMHRMPRVFGALLTMEAFLVEEMINFAGVCHDNRHAPAKARFLVDPGRELHHRLQCRLSRSYGGASYANLLALVLAAATSGLDWRSPDPHALRCRLTIAGAGGEGFSADSRISYATNQPAGPLTL